LTGKKKLNGFLDRLRENLEVLDEQIQNARVMSKKKDKDANALQWTKTLRDLIELRNVTLDKIKIHLLGRDQTGASTEPPDHYNGNSEVMFERDFQKFLSPWTRQNLELKCDDCRVKSEEVSGHYIETEEEHLNLCEKCYEKRETAPKILECEECHVKSEEVSHRKLPGHWIGENLFDGSEYDLCDKCYEERYGSNGEADGAKEVAEVGLLNGGAGGA
jgi:hypothetical protein